MLDHCLEERSLCSGYCVLAEGDFGLGGPCGAPSAVFALKMGMDGPAPCVLQHLEVGLNRWGGTCLAKSGQELRLVLVAADKVTGSSEGSTRESFEGGAMAMALAIKGSPD